MSKLTYKRSPDYTIPLGWLLEEYLEVRGYSQAEFTHRCGRSPKLIREIIAGKAPIELDMALQFEKLLGLGASVRVNMESIYRLQLAKEAEAKEAEAEAERTKSLLIRE